MEKETIYILELGVKDLEFENEDFVENEIASFDLDYLKEYGLNYVINGVDKTYYIIYKNEIDILNEEEKTQVKQSGYCDSIYNDYKKIIDRLETKDIEDLRPYISKEHDIMIEQENNMYVSKGGLK